MQALYTTIKKQAEGGNFPNLTTFTIYNKCILMNAYDIMQRPKSQLFSNFSPKTVLNKIPLIHKL